MVIVPLKEWRVWDDHPELLEDGPIQAHMMPGGAQFFAAGVE